LGFYEVRTGILPVASCTRTRNPLGRASPSERRRSMSAEENKAVSNRMAEAISRADFDAFDELMAPELAEEFKQGIAELHLAFPDYHGTNEIQVAEGDMVANRFVFYGTHQGEFMGVAPTGREVTFRGLSLDKVIDGKIVESIVEVDLEDVLGQIGAVVRAESSEGSEEASPT
jgi:predicted ester cyclase